MPFFGRVAFPLLLGRLHKPFAAPPMLSGLSVVDRLLLRLCRRDFMAELDRNGEIDLGKEARTSMSDSLESSSSAQICC